MLYLLFVNDYDYDGHLTSEHMTHTALRNASVYISCNLLLLWGLEDELIFHLTELTVEC